MGEFGGREDGGRNRVAWGRRVRRGLPSKAVRSGDGLHGSFGSMPPTSPPPLWSSVSRMELRLHRSWRGGSRPDQDRTEVEFHRYSGLGHGFGLVTGTSAKDGSTEPSGSGRSPSNQPQGVDAVPTPPGRSS